MPVIVVEMFEGRTAEQKRQLIDGLTSAFVKIGTPAEAVQIILKDNSRHNWGIGGKLASEKLPPK
ncbi:MAG: 2-hydroxymuconate tautomerase family protein [Chloroflexi bacterium]|nr:2-hydroxymuconate tautomerase family protein [Chloroflexota bacterium]